MVRCANSRKRRAVSRQPDRVYPAESARYRAELAAHRLSSNQSCHIIVKHSTLCRVRPAVDSERHRRDTVRADPSAGAGTAPENVRRSDDRVNLPVRAKRRSDSPSQSDVASFDLSRLLHLCREGARSIVPRRTSELFDVGAISCRRAWSAPAGAALALPSAARAHRPGLVALARCAWCGVAGECVSCADRGIRRGGTRWR